MTERYVPEPGIALVKLIPPTIKVPSKKYDTITEGTVVAINKENRDKNYLIGRVGHWREYKDDLRLGAKDTYAFIELGDIFGTDYKEEEE